MKNRQFIFGRHLYSQIVVPMLVAAVAVGVVASIVAVYAIDRLNDEWVTSMAKDSTEHAARMAASRALQVQEEVHTLGREILDATEADPREEALRVAVQSVASRHRSDLVVVLDASGRALAVASAHDVPYGSVPLGVDSDLLRGGPRVGIVRVDEEYMIVAVEPMPGTTTNFVAMGRALDSEFIDSIGVSHKGLLALYDGNMGNLGVTVGEELDRAASAPATRALRASGPEVEALLKAAAVDGYSAGPIRVAGSTYRATVQRLGLGSGEQTGTAVYIAGAIDEDVAVTAGRATRNTIITWSLLSVLSLVVLGRVVAKKVSDPLVDLAASARRIAEGDFNTKVDVVGAVEVAEVSESFNAMTDSLRERSETLTKKVLELATLYEMSRALGSTLDMDELLNSVLDSALRIFDLDLGYVVLREKDSSALEIRVLRAGGRNAAPDSAIRSTMSEWVVREGRPLIFNPDTASNDAQIDSVTGAKAALCVPLISAEGTIGSITIGSSQAGYRFNSDDVRLLSTIANHVTIAIGNIELFLSLQDAYLATVRSLATAVDAKDSYTRGHSDHVARYALLTAQKMGLSHDQLVALEMAAYLHDIGKIGVAEEILLKPGRLSDAEMEQMRHHPLIGANILRPVAFPWAINPVVRHHHESYDGGGYPAGLKGDEIPLLARILTVADSFEAMTADRPYRQGMTIERAIEELQACAGSQFDPRIVDLFLEVVAELEGAGDLHPVRAIDEISPDEARAVFVSVVDGVFASFRRLGGPRLASNVESELDTYFREHGMAFRIQHGRVAFAEDSPDDLGTEVDSMRAALRRMDATISRYSGTTLLDHFYQDALGGVSEHMRTLVTELDFYRG